MLTRFQLHSVSVTVNCDKTLKKGDSWFINGTECEVTRVDPVAGPRLRRVVFLKEKENDTAKAV